MMYGYDYEYEFPMPGMGQGLATGAIGVVIAILLIVLLVALAWAIASYVLTAVGMYRIAKRRGIHHPWLAWFPVGNAWLLGSIADHYQYIVKQKVTKRRKVLLILGFVSLGLGFVYGFLTALTGFTEDIAGSAGLTALSIISYLALMGVSIASAVFCYIAYFDMFQSCKPGNAVLFLVFGIIFNVTLPFFVFACSGSDQGMPAKRVTQVAAPIPYVPKSKAEAEPAQEEIPVVEAVLVEEDPVEENEE